MGAFESCPFTCIKNWNPTTTRTIGTSALTTAQRTTCSCAIGTYDVNYVCTLCEVGYYCTGGTRYACSTGLTTSSTGASSSSGCNICAVGYYMSGSTCTACSTGYTTSTTGASSSSDCSICANGYTLTGGYCAYVCSSAGATGCCQPRVFISNTVTSIGTMHLIILVIHCYNQY